MSNHYFSFCYDFWNIYTEQSASPHFKTPKQALQSSFYSVICMFHESNDLTLCIAASKIDQKLLKIHKVFLVGGWTVLAQLVIATTPINFMKLAKWRQNYTLFAKRKSSSIHFLWKSLILLKCMLTSLTLDYMQTISF